MPLIGLNIGFMLSVRADTEMVVVFSLHKHSVFFVPDSNVTIELVRELVRWVVNMSFLYYGFTWFQPQSENLSYS